MGRGVVGVSLTIPLLALAYVAGGVGAAVFWVALYRAGAASALETALAIGLLLAVIAGSVPLVAGQSSGASDYSLVELQAPGDRIPGAAPSQRWVRGGSVWVDSAESNPLQSSGSAEWAAETLLRPDATVDANSLRLHFQVGQDVGERRYNVTVVFYDVRTERYNVSVGNRTETRTRRIATNVTRTERTVNVSRAFAVKEVPLTPHYDDGKNAVMCVQPADAAGDCISAPDHSARWAGWSHKSARASEGTDVSTVGGLLWWATVNVVLPGVASVATFGAVGYLLLSRAGAGPRNPPQLYGLGGGPARVVALAVGWDALAAFVAAHPPAVGLAIGPVVAPFAAKTFNDGVRKLLLARPEVTEATTPTGDEGTDVLRWHLSELPIVERLGDGRPVVARPGVVPFVLRLLGARTPVEWDARTEVDVDGSTDYDQLAIVDPTAESAVEWDRGSIGLDTPDTPEPRTDIDALRGLGSWAVFAGKVFGALVVGAALADGLVGLWWVGLVAVVPVAVTAVERAAEIPLASVHGRAAVATMLVGQQEASAAETLDETRDALWRERAKGQQEVEAVLDDADRTLLSEAAAGDVDVSADGDGPLDGGREGDDGE